MLNTGIIRFAIGWTVRVWNPGGAGALGAHPASYTMGIGFLSHE